MTKPRPIDVHALERDAVRQQEMRYLLDLAERSGPLPRGTRASVEGRFYAKARAWVPFLVRHYLGLEAEPDAPK